MKKDLSELNILDFFLHFNTDYDFYAEDFLPDVQMNLTRRHLTQIGKNCLFKDSSETVFA